MGAIFYLHVIEIEPHISQVEANGFEAGEIIVL